MYEIDIWIDLSFQEDGKRTTACTLFATQTVPMRPLPNESMTYNAPKGTHPAFKLQTPLAQITEHAVRTTVEEVRHYAYPAEDGVRYKTSVRCHAIEACTLEDVKAICQWMVEHFQFEVDPYATNRLEHV